MNRVRKCWEERRCAVSGWLQLPGALHAEALARLSYDALVLDLQHSPIDFAQAVSMLAAIELGGAEPFVRMQVNSAADAMKLLDAGAYGVISPMVNTVEDARHFASALNYPPLGTRSYGPRRPSLRYGADYWGLARQSIVGLAMIETREAVANLHDILAVEGLDGVFIGPTDLAVEYGYAPHVDSTEPELVQIIAGIREAAHAANKKVGIYCGAAPFAKEKIAEGFDLITAAPDLGLLVGAAQQLLSSIRN